MSLPWEPDDRVPRAADAIVPSPLELRASDAEREAVAEALRDHARAGRLDEEELEERLGLAYRAPHRHDLAALLDDLPAASDAGTAPDLIAPAPSAPRSHGEALAPARGGHWASLGAVAGLLVLIWAIGGAGPFWPGWVLVVLVILAVRRRRRRR